MRLALRGYRLYDVLINGLVGGYDAATRLAAIMLPPRVVQIALLESARMVVPAALMYDYPLDSGADGYALCREFADCLTAGASLDELSCFKGGCPSFDDDTVVCPSGFWGYRHALGLPLSAASAPDPPTRIRYVGAPDLAVSMSTDPQLIERESHEQALRALRADVGWSYADTRAGTLDLLRATHAHLVYFYCHGGVVNKIPYLEVGYEEKGITRDNIRAKKIRWHEPRPLVFINGCETTALQPETALEFVSAFVENAQAAGVVGTEITVFEHLARSFAEDCLTRFLDGIPMGEAVRLGRLALLADANPLGLAYIPFVVSSLRLLRSRDRRSRLLAEATGARSGLRASLPAPTVALRHGSGRVSP